MEWIAACFDYYAEIGRDAVRPRDQPGGPQPVQLRDQGAVRRRAGSSCRGTTRCCSSCWKLAPGARRGQHRGGQAQRARRSPTLRLAAARFEELPDGVVNVVTGYGARGGRRRSSRTATSSWWPSRAARPPAARWRSTCAEQLKKCHLELGGNDPLIVDEGVDLDVAARGAAWACFLNMGQVCTSAERLYVVGKAYDGVRRALRGLHEDAASSAIPSDPTSTSGPMISAVQREKVEQKMAASLGAARGSRWEAARPRASTRGFFYEPTVAARRRRLDMALMREETFGPVAPIVRCQRHRRGDRPGRPQRVRARRLDLHEQPRARHEGHGAGPRRHLLDQRPPDRQRRRALRRHARRRDRPRARAARGSRTSATASTSTSTT